MSDLVDEESMFKGGTLQLSAEGDVEPERMQSAQPIPATEQNYNPSVLSGLNSLSSSSSSLPEMNYNLSSTINETTQENAVYPRYDMPFSRENIQDFFTYRKGVVETAIQECITAMIFPEDGEILGGWLLTEITSWDNEKERIVLLTNKLVMTIKYDFIALKKVDFKKTYLNDLDSIVIGELVYPPTSLVPRLNGLATGVSSVLRECLGRRWPKPRPEPDPSPVPEAAPPHPSRLFDTKYFEPRERNLRGVRLWWGGAEAQHPSALYNPFGSPPNLLTFASHPLYWYKGGGEGGERETYDMERFAQMAAAALTALRQAQGAGEAAPVRHEPVLIHNYVGVASLVHNKNSLGFFKVRGKFSF